MPANCNPLSRGSPKCLAARRPEQRVEIKGEISVDQNNNVNYIISVNLTSLSQDALALGIEERRERERAETRERILDVARELFTGEGYDGVTMRMARQLRTPLLPSAIRIRCACELTALCPGTSLLTPASSTYVTADAYGDRRFWAVSCALGRSLAGRTSARKNQPSTLIRNSGNARSVGQRCEPARRPARGFVHFT